MGHADAAIARSFPLNFSVSSVVSVIMPVVSEDCVARGKGKPLPERLRVVDGRAA